MTTNAAFSEPITLIGEDRRQAENSAPSRKSNCAFVPRGKTLQATSVVSLSLTSFLFGNNIGWSTAVADTINKTYSRSESSWVVSIVAPMAVVGALLWGLIVTRLGPRKSSLAIGIPYIIGWSLLLYPTTLWSTLLGRALCGLATGGTVAMLPPYVTDVAEDALRGALGSLLIVTMNLGILITYSLGYFNPFVVSMFSLVVSVIFCVVFFPCPESPRYLFATGQDAAAEETLRKLRTGSDIAQQIAAVRSGAVKPSNNARTSPIDLLRGRAAIMATVISLGVLSIQQGSGISPVHLYTGDIFAKSGGDMDPITSSCIVGVVQLLGSIVGSVLMDKAGRRILMLVSCFFMAVSEIVLGFAFAPATVLPGWVPVVALSVYIVAYSVGAGPAPFVITGEVFAPRVRNMACSIAMAYNYTLSFVFTKVFPDLSLLMGTDGVFWLYAGVCIAGFVFVWFVVPETAGRSSASIQAQLSGKKELLTRV